MPLTESGAIGDHRWLGSFQPVPASRATLAPGELSPQAPQLCSPKGKHFFQCRSVDHPTFREWLALAWTPLSGSPGLLELARKAGFRFKGDFLSPHGLPCRAPSPPPPGWHLPRAAGCAPATLLTSAEGMLLPLLHAAQKSRQKAGVQLQRVRKRNNLVSKSGLSTTARHWKGASRLKGR